MRRVPSLRELRANTPSNVAILPTAAPRQVDNYRYAEQRRAGGALKRADDNPFKDRFIHHQRREALQLAETVRTIAPTAALLLTQAICRALTDEQRTAVVEQLAPGVVRGCEVHKQALAVFRVSRMTVGQRCDFDWAMDRLHDS